VDIQNNPLSRVNNPQSGGNKMKIIIIALWFIVGLIITICGYRENREVSLFNYLVIWIALMVVLIERAIIN